MEVPGGNDYGDNPMGLLPFLFQANRQQAWVWEEIDMGQNSEYQLKQGFNDL